MRLDDLPADRQAEPGILAERLARRPVGVEALEDAVDVVGADAGAVVVDGDDDRTCRPARGEMAMRPVLVGHEGAGVLDQVGDHLAEAQIVADTKKLLAPCGSFAGLELDLDVLLVAAGFARNGDQIGDEASSGRRVSASSRAKFGVEPRGIGNVGDQPVEPAHVVLDDLHQPARASPRSWRAARSRRRCAARSAGSSAHARRRRRSSRSPRCARRARWSCRAAPPRDCRSRPGGRRNRESPRGS